MFTTFFTVTSIPSPETAPHILLLRQLLLKPVQTNLTLTRLYSPLDKFHVDQCFTKNGIEVPYFRRDKLHTADVNKDEFNVMTVDVNFMLTQIWELAGCEAYDKTVGGGNVKHPPIPHCDWCEVLGFQSTNPIEDFRSSGILGLSLMYHVLKQTLNTSTYHTQNYPPTLPFAMTIITITSELFLSSNPLLPTPLTSEPEVILSSKCKFWKYFDDPTNVLAFFTTVYERLPLELMKNANDNVKNKAGKGDVIWKVGYNSVNCVIQRLISKTVTEVVAGYCRKEGGGGKDDGVVGVGVNGVSSGGGVKWRNERDDRESAVDSGRNVVIARV